MLRSILVLLLLFETAGAAAATGLSEQNPIDVTVLLGTKDEDLVFVPNKQTFETDRLYRLVLLNPTSQTHYFSAPGFSDAVSSHKLELEGVEIEGAFPEIALKAGTRAAWFFVPARAGSYDLECTFPGHAKAGMTGTLEIR